MASKVLYEVTSDSGDCCKTQEIRTSRISLVQQARSLSVHGLSETPRLEDKEIPSGRRNLAALIGIEFAKDSKFRPARKPER